MAAQRNGGRVSTALVSLVACIALGSPPASAVTQVVPGDPGGGFTGASHQSATVSGTATSGSASSNASGSQLSVTYGTPADGTQYSGTAMVQVVNADGSVSINTWPVSDFGNGLSGYESGFGAPIPLGGSASITINESNSNGSTFQAGFTVDNFGK